MVPHASLDDAAVARVRLLEETTGVRAFVGAEVRIHDDGAVPDAARARERADLVVALVDPDGRERTRDESAERVTRAIASGAVDVLRRPTGRVLLEDPGVDVDIWAVLKAAARHRVIVEVSGDPRHLDLDARSCRTNLQVGALLGPASEARAPEELVPRLGFALSQARRGWIGRELVANAMTREAFEDWVAARRGGAPKARARPALSSWIAEDPLARALEQEPLPADLVARLERFLVGEADADLEKALVRASGNALQRAFELVSRARSPAT